MLLESIIDNSEYRKKKILEFLGCIVIDQKGARRRLKNCGVFFLPDAGEFLFGVFFSPPQAKIFWGVF